jgi:AbrB family looped-hinge helix DNA binding protein
MSVTNVVRVGPKGRVVIPAEVRDQLDIGEGDELAVVVDGRSVRLMPTEHLLAGLRGALTGSGVDVVAELLAERRASARAEAS